MVEAAGIEHFAKSIKTIGYIVTMPKSCLKNFTADGDLGVPDILRGYETCHGDNDAWKQIVTTI